jgi:hypothetical protein
MRHLKADPARIRREFWQGEPTYGRLFALLHEHNAERVGKPRWGDKSLHIEHYSDRIFAEFPNAKVIQMIRDPRDRYASVRKRFGKDTPRLGASTARWLRAVRYGQRNLKRYPDDYQIVRYESLASSPEDTLREICSFIGEEYAPGMLAMQGANEYRESGGNSSFEKIEPGVISTRAIGRFQTVLTSAEIAFIQMTCGPEMMAYNYLKTPVAFTPQERLDFVVKTLPSQLARLAGWWALTALQSKRGARPPVKRFEDELTHSIGEDNASIQSIGS